MATETEDSENPLILCCADCEQTVTGRGSWCGHCKFSPSMQDTMFVRWKNLEARPLSPPPRW